jgi:hypothetical protein
LSWTVESCRNIYWATFSVSVHQSSSSSLFPFSFSFIIPSFLLSLPTPPFSSCCFLC